MNEVNETDWKYFRSQLDTWREHFLSKVNQKIASILTDEKLNETDKFWKLKKACEQKAWLLSDCFDDIGRSTMLLRLAAMYKNKIITNDDLQTFQDESVKQIEKW